MAIDTQQKRCSAMNVGSPWRGLLPWPDGAIGQADRQQTAFLYSGILATAATIPDNPGLFWQAERQVPLWLSPDTAPVFWQGDRGPMFWVSEDND